MAHSHYNILQYTASADDDLNISPKYRLEPPKAGASFLAHMCYALAPFQSFRQLSSVNTYDAKNAEAHAELNELISPKNVAFLPPDSLGHWQCSLHENMYYQLMRLRLQFPHIFPVHDVCLLMANCLYMQLQEHNDKACIVLDSWHLLPVALLAAHFGARVLLPCNQDDYENAVALQALLQEVLPKGDWKNVQWALQAQTQCYLLTQDPLLLNKPWMHTLHWLGGVMLVGWDFLGSRTSHQLRRQWLKTGRIAGVLQLPRPRRQSSIAYPAILTFSPTPTAHIRLCRIATWGVGPGVLNMKLAITLLHDDTATEHNADELSILMETNRIYHTQTCNLTPAYHISRNLQAKQISEVHENTLLKNVAEVLRCQIPRQAFDKAACISTLSKQEHKAIPDILVYNEMALADVDDTSSFVNMHGGQAILLADTHHTVGKYLLQEGDILLTFRGSGTSIGKVAYVDDLPAFGTVHYTHHLNAADGTRQTLFRVIVDGYIAGTSMLLIRPFDMDPIWLFAYLRRTCVRQHLQSQASGSRLLTVTMEAVRNLPIPRPQPDALALVHEHHQKVARSMSKVKDLLSNVHESIAAVETFMQQWEQSQPNEKHPSSPR